MDVFSRFVVGWIAYRESAELALRLRARQVFCVNGHTFSNFSALVDWADLSEG